MTPKDFKRTGHERPSAYVRESHPQMGVKLYDHWIAPHDLKEFAAWIIGAYEWCELQSKGEAKSKGAEIAQADNIVQELEGSKVLSVARSQSKRKA